MNDFDRKFAREISSAVKQANGADKATIECAYRRVLADLDIDEPDSVGSKWIDFTWSRVQSMPFKMLAQRLSEEQLAQKIYSEIAKQ